jgi:hypothetical protein
LLWECFWFFTKEKGPRHRRGPFSFVKKYVVNLRPTQMLSGFDKGD